MNNRDAEMARKKEKDLEDREEDEEKNVCVIFSSLKRKVQ